MKFIDREILRHLMIDAAAAAIGVAIVALPMSLIQMVLSV